MQRRHSHIPQNQISAPLAGELLDALDRVKALPHNLTRAKKQPYGHSYATSAGKPWFDYDVYTNQDASSERRRIRIIERWMGTDTMRGVIKIGMQYVFRIPDVTQQTVHIDTRGNDRLGLLQGGSGLQDVITSQQLRLAVLANGTMYGRLMLRADSQHPYTGGVARDCEEASRVFYAEQPLLEEDYRHTAVDDTIVATAVADMHSFIDSESHLGKLRAALGYGHD